MKKPATSRPSSPISKTRLEFLFDGIFAIAMTILVLEIKVPELSDRHSVAELGQALKHHASVFISYLLSFFMLGMLWYHHNQHFRHLERITKGILFLHLVQLASAAFFPFCAALIGRYATNPLSMVVYIGCIITYRWASTAQWMLAKKSASLSRDLTQAEYRHFRKRNWIVSTLMTGMFLLYLFNTLTK